MGETYEEFVKRTGCDPEAVYWQAKKADAWAEEQRGNKMSKGYDEGLWDGFRFGCGLSVVILLIVLAVLSLGYCWATVG